ncbi:sugar phosphate isomerase/epimerase family protein [Lacticaseibacillus mingshuiensis]|uniref:sugar phosphate isomerase/epimerase family protein n=1 Tax=Lacticaseibacillus mingshuiensis TaxID=2799574 RepID=UPI00195295E3|nr:sugar phosphate isomerase/epimerase [Lacticaseibacillus mingshuiensis]
MPTSKPLRAGLQLYSVGEAMAADSLGTLKQVGDMGYDGVEFAGYFDQPASTLAHHVACDGMVVAGSHIGLENFEDLESVMAYETKLGNHNVIVPWMNFASLDEWADAMARLEALALRLAAHDFSLIYHNHGHEFTAFAGVDLLDELTRRAPHVQLEVDTYWLAYAGKNVLAWLEAHADRVAMLHIKDMAGVGDARESVVLGTGDLPLEDYAKFAQAHGIEWLVVEQEAFSQMSPMAAAAQNASYLKKLIGRLEE